MDQIGQLRPRLEAEIHLHRAPCELVEVKHLSTPGRSFAGIDSGTHQKKDNQKHDEDCGQQHNGVDRYCTRVEETQGQAITQHSWKQDARKNAFDEKNWELFNRQRPDHHLGNYRAAQVLWPG
jgi:hypothetical protein